MNKCLATRLRQSGSGRECVYRCIASCRGKGAEWGARFEVQGKGSRTRGAKGGKGQDKGSRARGAGLCRFKGHRVVLVRGAWVGRLRCWERVIPIVGEGGESQGVGQGDETHRWERCAAVQ
jgi:hypothetical protein